MKIKKFIFRDFKYLYVDWDYLKSSYENGYLQGAHVFARLFDMIDDGLFVSQEKEEYDLDPYGIYIEDWTLFYSFVRNGYIPNTYDIEKNVKEMNYCYKICIKFGGVPEFERYYNSFFYNETDISGESVYNPMTPIDDKKGLFTWRVVTSFTSLKTNESVTACVASEPVTIFYCRKPILSQGQENNT